MLGSLHRPDPRLQCEPAAAAHNWAAVAAVCGSPGLGPAGSGRPCLSTRGSAPGALGGRQAPLSRGHTPPPVQAYPWPELALSPAQTCSSAPTSSGRGPPGFPYGMHREVALAAPMSPSLTPAAAQPSSLVSPFSAAAASEMRGAFLGAAAPPTKTPGSGAHSASRGAGGGGKWPTPRPTAGAGPGARAASFGSNASEDTAAPPGPDLHTAPATMQARARRASKRLLFW